MQQMQLVSLALAAIVGCGCIFAWKKRLPTETLWPAVPDEHQPGCFGLEEEKGGNWKGSEKKKWSPSPAYRQGKSASKAEQESGFGL